MCSTSNNQSLANTSIGTEAAGGLLTTLGSYNLATSQKDTLAVNAAMQMANARIAEQQAQLAQINGQMAEQTSQLHTGQVFGAQRAAMAANGVDLGLGSANNVLATTRFMGNRDALTIADNATRQAWGYRVQEADANATGSLMQSAANDINPIGTGAATLLGGAGQVAKSWYNFSKQGTNPFGIGGN